MLGQLRNGVVGGQQDIGKRLVVAQQHVVARHEALDEIAFQQQGLDLGVGLHHLHGHGFRHHALQAPRQFGDLGVARNPALQVACLADIDRIAAAVEHAIDAGTARQRLHGVGDDGDALREALAPLAGFVAGDGDAFGAGPDGEGLGGILLHPHGRAFPAGGGIPWEALGSARLMSSGHRRYSGLSRASLGRKHLSGQGNCNPAGGLPRCRGGPRAGARWRRCRILSTEAVDKSVIIHLPPHQGLREFYIFVKLPKNQA